MSIKKELLKSPRPRKKLLLQRKRLLVRTKVLQRAKKKNLLTSLLLSKQKYPLFGGVFVS